MQDYEAGYRVREVETVQQFRQDCVGVDEQQEELPRDLHRLQHSHIETIYAVQWTASLSLEFNAELDYWRENVGQER